VTRVRALGIALLSLVLTALPRTARAQGEIQIVVPTGGPFPAAPRLVVRAAGFPATLGALRIRIRLSLSANIGLVIYDSTKAGPEAAFTMTRLLPEDRAIFAEVTVLDERGAQMQQRIILVGSTGRRLELIEPSGTTSVSLNTLRPRFSWRSAQITTPPGPWVYELYVTNVATQETRSRGAITDTVYQWPDTLQANTSYRWRVVARPLNGLLPDSVSVSSLSSFVIAPSDQPLTTLLYQNFPNPFPALSSQTTCIWFDLRTAAEVRLMIYDLRGNPVRTIVPSAQFPGTLTSGRYGRLNDAESKGCDPRLAWDGTSDDGRTVAAGVYLVRLKADGYDSMKKIVFRGR
jgi:hypothetical protein